MAHLLVSTLFMACAIHCIFGQITDTCTEQINSCACKTKNGYINLEKLDQAKINGQPKWTGIVDSTYPDTTYSYNPCTPYNDPSPVAAAQTQHSVVYPIGTQDSARFTTDSTMGTTLTYTATVTSTTYSNGRTTKVQLVCDPSVEGTLTNAGDDLNNPGTYLMTLTSKYACADIAPPPPGHEMTTAESVPDRELNIELIVIIALSFLLALIVVAAIAIACYKCCKSDRVREVGAKVNIFMVSPSQMENAASNSKDGDTKCLIDI